MADRRDDAPTIDPLTNAVTTGVVTALGADLTAVTSAKAEALAKAAPTPPSATPTPPSATPTAAAS